MSVYPAPAQKSVLNDVALSALPLFFARNPLPDTEGKILVLTHDRRQARNLQAAWAFFAPEKSVVCLPDWETLPYERFSPHRDLVSERLFALWQVLARQADILLVPVAVAMQKLPPPAFIAGRTFFLKKGGTLDADSLRKNLIDAGYSAVSHVVAAGEFAVRGSLIDLFPSGSKEPYRIDLFDKEIDSIKVFDIETQRTVAAVDEIRLLPAHEFPTDEAAQTLFRQRFRELIEGDASEAVPYRAVSDGLFGGGVEYYLPLFFENGCVPLTVYLPENVWTVAACDIPQAAQAFEKEIKTRFTYAQGDAAYPPLAPQHLFLDAAEFQAALKPLPRLIVPPLPQNSPAALPDIAVDRRKEKPLAALQAFQAAFDGRILLCASGAGRRETLGAFLRRQGFSVKNVAGWAEFLADDAPFCLTVAQWTDGFIVHRQPENGGAAENYAVITEGELYPHLAKNTPRTRQKYSNIAHSALHDLAEIRVGDPVVHEAHGIGRYLGLVNMDLGEGTEEMMLLEYADGGKLYVPVAQLHVISRYAGAAHDAVTLHRLGSASWAKDKKKAAQKARDTAAELLSLYARRAARDGFAATLDETAYQAFADGFGYEETPDQTAAIVAVVRDLLDTKPMDRLVCGDVGFGKTEVALRAAFISAMSGRQVAVLAPTTLLVDQHMQVFSARFVDFPVKVAALSRFSSGKNSREILAGMADGTIDIVIGTHKLVQKGVTFANLGLVIIDEEHRFGVRQKEQLKKLRSNVDVLTLTATPIPRTLSMALDGLRDLSLITTAPSRRLSVKTFVRPFGEGTIREAMLRELKRGGQVFFLHNEVETIENMREKLEKLMPEARIGVAHGQLPTHELENVMRQFLRQQFNVLLCSTIIETGIDIPNANTIIINRADKFGIAQLHQLRGRVGRSHHQAYAYLLTPESITRDAQKRLDAIAAADELGSGFLLAMQDLEIRGAGEILGEGQSGEITQVGLTLYSEMLKRAVNDLKAGRIPDFDTPADDAVEIKLHTPALLPESYCPDVHERLVLYKRLAACSSDEEIDDIKEELIDRFGLPEAPVKNLIASHRLRLIAQQHGITVIDAAEDGITLTLGSRHRLDLARIIALIQSDKNYRLAGQNKLKIRLHAPDTETRIHTVRTVIGRLAENAEA